MLTPAQFAKKTNEILGQYISTNDAKKYADEFSAHSKEILTEATNTTFHIKSVKGAIDRIIQEQMKEALRPLRFDQSEMHKALAKLLAKYTDDERTINVIFNDVKKTISEGFENYDYPYHLLDDVIRANIYEALWGLPKTKKTLEFESFFFDFVPFLETYANIIHDVQDYYEQKIKKPLLAAFDDTISPAQKIIDEQALMLKNYEDALFYEVFKELEEVRSDLMPVKAQYYNAYMADVPDGLSLSDFEQTQLYCVQRTEDLCLEAEMNVMNAAVDRWLKHKPEILKQLIDFDAVRDKARRFVMHNEQVEANDIKDKALKAHEEKLLEHPQLLNAQELQTFAERLSHFLNKAKAMHLDILFDPNIGVRLNPENRKYHLNADTFVQFFNILPYAIKDAFINRDVSESFTEKDLIGMGLKSWQKSETATKSLIDFMQNEKILQDAKSYLDLHNEKIIAGLSKKITKVKQIDESKMVRELGSGTNIQLQFEASLFKAISKGNKSLVDVMLPQCNIDTLKSVFKKMSLPQKYEFGAQIVQKVKKLEAFKKHQSMFFVNNHVSNDLKPPKSATTDSRKFSF